MGGDSPKNNFVIYYDIILKQTTIDLFIIMPVVKKSKKKSTEDKKNVKGYTHLRLSEQILHRPDTYIGSVENVPVSDCWVLGNEQKAFEQRTVNINEGIIHLFNEILSNAIDNVSRSRANKVPTKYIKVEFNEDTQELSVKNDGIEIGLEDHIDKNGNKIPLPQLIFGNLLTSNNYDDSEEERKTGGRNGYGSKLTNIFSTKFKVEIFNSSAGQVYVQEWNKNMSSMKKERRRAKEKGMGYTKISWIPDFARFKLEKYSRDHIDILRKKVADASMITGIACYFNKDKYNFKKISQYAMYYHPGKDMSSIINVSYRDTDIAIVFKPSRGFTQISFVNGINTQRGGAHIDKICELLFRPIVENVNKKEKKISLNDVKKHFALYVNTWVDKPQFSSQTKEYLTRPVPDIEIANTIKKKVLKCGVLSAIKNILERKELKAISSEDRKKMKRKKRSVNIDDANKAGSSKSRDCLLVITEGKSAKTFASAGIESGIPFNGKKVCGRDYIGFLTLTGKILNVENAGMKQISSNTAINELKQALGVELSTDYTKPNNFKKLRYGGVVILTDADVDGDHIKGLLLLAFKKLWPSLLDINFVSSMLTPIGRIIFKGKKKNLVFYNEGLFRQWIAKNVNSSLKFKVKYYKGLGTSSSDEVLDIFGRRMVYYKSDDKSDETFTKVFSSSQSNARKDWIRAATGKSEIIKSSGPGGLDTQDSSEKQTHSNFLDKNLINYSISSCERSIPSVVDGLKESTRKILYGVLQKEKEIKVSQLAGFVAEKCHYQHGEQNLPSTIIGLGQVFVGSNNIPLLYRGGQFGSRISNGSDAASGRYVTTKPDGLTRNIFLKSDEPILNNRVVDGECVEPEFFVPILPMILVNGITGIGTGWSSTVPCYNPRDIISNVKKWIESRKRGEENFYTDMTPWYRGFEGTIEKDKDSDVKYVCSGIMKRIDDKRIEVSEIPIGMSTDQFREHLEKLRERGSIVSFDNNSNVVDVNFTIKLPPGSKDLTMKDLKLQTYISTNNMTVFDAKKKICELKSPREVFELFCPVRLAHYNMRKKFEVERLEEKLKNVSNRFRFITEIVEGKLDIMKKKKSVIEEELEEKLYDRKIEKVNIDKVMAQGTLDVNIDDAKKGSYKYLLDIPVRFFTEEEIEKLAAEKGRVEVALDKRRSLLPEEDWLGDLEELNNKLGPWFKGLKLEDDKLRGTKKKASKKKA